MRLSILYLTPRPGLHPADAVNFRRLHQNPPSSSSRIDSIGRSGGTRSGFGAKLREGAPCFRLRLCAGVSLLSRRSAPRSAPPLEVSATPFPLTSAHTTFHTTRA